MKYLEMVDIYGVSLTLLTFKKDKFKSGLGGFLTIFAVMTGALSAFLFGRDFWFRTNPNVSMKDIMPDESRIIHPNSKNFTILFRLENWQGVELENKEQLAVPYFLYSHYKRNADKEMKVLVEVAALGVPCSETPAVENEYLADFDLTRYSCVDWENLEEMARKVNPELGEDFKPIIGGTWEEDEIGFISIRISDHLKGENNFYTRKDYDDLANFVKSYSFYISIFYPEYYFDASSLSNPMKVYWKNYFYNLIHNMHRLDRFFLSFAKLEDDVGWIFEDVQNSYALTKSAHEVEMYLIDKEIKRNQIDLYIFLLYFQKAQTGLRRTFMKVQELGALIGGSIQLVHFIFGFAASSYAKYLRLVKLENHLEPRVEVEKKDKIVFSTSKNISNIREFEVKRSADDTRNSLNRQVKNRNKGLSYMKYTYYSIFRSKTNDKYKKVNEFHNFFCDNIDVSNLFSLSKRVKQLEDRSSSHVIGGRLR